MFRGTDVPASRRVLVVEDNPDGRESLRLLLLLLGHEVDTAADGAEGVEKALEVRPDVAIVDIGLPRLNGYEVARRIRAARGDTILLIACTAYDHPDARRRVMESGFDAHLVKPMEISELLPWLENGPRVESMAGC